MVSPLKPLLAEASFGRGLKDELQQGIQRLLAAAASGLLSQQNTVLTDEVPRLLAGLAGTLGSVYGVTHHGLTGLATTATVDRLRALAPDVLEDIDAALANDPATDDPLEIALCYPGFRATLAHRVAHILYGLGTPLLPRMIAELAHQETGIDIHPGARIGPRFFIDHGTGVVIGESAEIGSGVTLYQGVTLGAKRFARDAQGRVVKGLPRHPIIEDDVTIYSGATVLGRIRVGRGSIIGGNVWLTESVPPNSRILQQHFVASLFRDGDGI